MPAVAWQRVLLAVSLLLMEPLSASAQWTQFQGNAAHTGYASSFVVAPLLTPVWSIGAPNYSQGPADRDVAIVDGDVYATMVDTIDGVVLSRFDGATGDVVWQAEVRVYSGISAPAVGTDTVYLHHWGHSGSSGSVYPQDYPALVGFDRDTGEQRFWTTHEGQWGSGSRPTVEGDSVFAAGGYYGGLDSYALDGEHNWFHDVNQQYGWQPAADAENVYVYMGAGGGSLGAGSLFIVDRTTGTRTATLIHPASEHALENLQSVMLGGNDDALALTLNGHPAGLNRRTLVSFDISSESINWEITGDFFGIAAVANGVIAIPDANELRFVDQLTGNDLWTWDGGDYVRDNVVLTDDYAFVHASGSVHAIDLDTHFSVWNSAGVTGTIALENDLLVISNPDGVFAFSVVPEASSLVLCAVGIVAAAVTAWRSERHRRSLQRN